MRSVVLLLRLPVTFLSSSFNTRNAFQALIDNFRALQRHTFSQIPGGQQHADFDLRGVQSMFFAQLCMKSIRNFSVGFLQPTHDRRFVYASRPLASLRTALKPATNG